MRTGVRFDMCYVYKIVDNAVYCMSQTHAVTL